MSRDINDFVYMSSVYVAESNETDFLKHNVTTSSIKTAVQFKL